MEKLTEVHRLEDELFLYWGAEEPHSVLQAEDGDTEDVWGGEREFSQLNNNQPSYSPHLLCQ